ncbi:MAG TPA: hypothetical protein VH682_25455 [Gemmataceae bacterium]
MIDLLAGLLLLTGVYPLAQALRANRHTTLWQPLLWALLAWAAWTGAAWNRVLCPGENEQLACYGALCLTGCAGVAVLGARRPGVAAWNFVVVGLLAVLLLPVLNGLGEPHLEAMHWLFLGVTLAVPILNYLPTRLSLAAVLLAAGCGCEMAVLLGAAPQAMHSTGMGCLGISPWAAAFFRGRAVGTAFDRLWLAYRDRFGFVWGQRMREQFNRAAHHAGWLVTLRWHGLHAAAPEPVPDPAELLALLRAVLKRFGPEEDQPRTEPH